MCGHYRDFFRMIGVATNIYIVYGLNCPSVNESYVKGYNEKFFFDRGALYVPLYGCMAKPLALRWLFAHQGLFFKNNQEVVNVKQAYNLMKQGMKEYLR